MKTITINKKMSSKIAKNLSFVVALMLTFTFPMMASAETLTRQLQLGMSGSDVSSLQTFLAQDNTIYPQGLVTGYFGGLTKSAVSNFQVRNGLPSVGRVGPATLPIINAQMSGGLNTGSNREAPILGSASIGVTSNSASINWNTNEAASAIVYYSPSPIYMTEASATSAVTISGTPLLASTDLRLVHTANISNLQSNTSYNYVIYVRDGQGNESITLPSVFRTN